MKPRLNQPAFFRDISLESESFCKSLLLDFSVLLSEMNEYDVIDISLTTNDKDLLPSTIQNIWYQLGLSQKQLGKVVKTEQTVGQYLSYLQEKKTTNFDLVMIIDVPVNNLTSQFASAILLHNDTSQSYNKPILAYLPRFMETDLLNLDRDLIHLIHLQETPDLIQDFWFAGFSNESKTNYLRSLADATFFNKNTPIVHHELSWLIGSNSQFDDWMYLSAVLNVNTQSPEQLPNVLMSIQQGNNITITAVINCIDKTA